MYILPSIYLYHSFCCAFSTVYMPPKSYTPDFLLFSKMPLLALCCARVQTLSLVAYPTLSYPTAAASLASSTKVSIFRHTSRYAFLIFTFPFAVVPVTRTKCPQLVLSPLLQVLQFRWSCPNYFHLAFFEYREMIKKIPGVYSRRRTWYKVSLLFLSYPLFCYNTSPSLIYFPRLIGRIQRA